jgi:hypothetical protein
VIKFFKNHNDSKFVKWIYFFPVIIFFLETTFVGSLNNVNTISIICYNFLTAFLMLNLLISNNNLKKTIIKIVKAFFVFHSVSFIYFLAEGKIRLDKELMPIVYPFYLLNVIGFNFYVGFYLWLVRRK